MTRSIGKSLQGALGAAALALLVAPALVALTTSAESGETLRVAVREQPAQKGNAYQGCICTPAVYTWAAIFQQLTAIGNEGQTVPLLAASWENIDPTRWRIHLRQDVKFSNGEPMNAEAVASTYAYWTTEEGEAFSQSKTMSRFVAGTEVVDEYTIDILTPEPDPILPKRLQSQSIVPKRAWADLGLADFSQEPIGTGPFVVTFGPESSTAIPNPLSWLKIQSVDRIEFITLNEAPARVQALVSGQIDINTSVAPDEIPIIEAAGMVVYSKPSVRTMGISLVSTRSNEPVEGPIGDVRVRQALNYAVNRQSIVDNIFRGKAAPATQAAFPGANGYNPDIVGYPYNPEKARALLAEAGYPNGFEMEVHALTDAEDFRLTYEAAIQDLRKIGVNASLFSQKFAGKGGWLEHWLAGDWPYEGFGIGHDLGATMDAARAFNNLSSCKKPNPFFCDESESALQDAINVEFDADKRRKMLQEWLAIHTEKAPIIFLVEFDESMAHNPRITNFEQTTLIIPYHKLQVNPQ